MCCSYHPTDSPITRMRWGCLWALMVQSMRAAREMKADLVVPVGVMRWMEQRTAEHPILGCRFGEHPAKGGTKTVFPAGLGESARRQGAGRSVWRRTRRRCVVTPCRRPHLPKMGFPLKSLKSNYRKRRRGMTSNTHPRAPNACPNNGDWYLAQTRG